tara:strand:- start:1353 stop:1742 length:390 start_codon:yes stop_codon:yes gene_type:complete
LNNSLTQDQPGKIYGPYDVSVSKSQSDEYCRIFGISPRRSLPPLIYVAFALTKLINELGIISKDFETIHGGQEVKWHKPVTPGEKITAKCKLKSNIERKKIRFASITVEYISGNDTIGKSTTVIIIKQG